MIKKEKYRIAHLIIKKAEQQNKNLNLYKVLKEFEAYKRYYVII